MGGLSAAVIGGGNNTITTAIQVVKYTGSAWPTRPATATGVPVIWDSSLYSAAPAPTGGALVGDKWWRYNVLTP